MRRVLLIAVVVVAFLKREAIFKLFNGEPKS